MSVESVQGGKKLLCTVDGFDRFDGFDSVGFGVEVNMCSTFEVSYRSLTDVFEF